MAFNHRSIKPSVNDRINPLLCLLTYITMNKVVEMEAELGKGLLKQSVYKECIQDSASQPKRSHAVKKCSGTGKPCTFTFHLGCDQPQ